MPKGLRFVDESPLWCAGLNTFVARRRVDRRETLFFVGTDGAPTRKAWQIPKASEFDAIAASVNGLSVGVIFRADYGDVSRQYYIEFGAPEDPLETVKLPSAWPAQGWSLYRGCPTDRESGEGRWIVGNFAAPLLVGNLAEPLGGQFAMRLPLNSDAVPVSLLVAPSSDTGDLLFARLDGSIGSWSSEGELTTVAAPGAEILGFVHPTPSATFALRRNGELLNVSGGREGETTHLPGVDGLGLVAIAGNWIANISGDTLGDSSVLSVGEGWDPLEPSSMLSSWNEVRIFEITAQGTASLQSTFQASMSAQAIALSSDWLAVASSFNTLQVFSRDDPGRGPVFQKTFSGGTSALAIRGGIVAVGGEDGSVRLIEIKGRRRRGLLAGPVEKGVMRMPVGKLLFTRDESLVVIHRYPRFGSGRRSDSPPPVRVWSLRAAPDLIGNGPFLNGGVVCLAPLEYGDGLEYWVVGAFGSVVRWRPVLK